jgi:hypothetical protein
MIARKKPRLVFDGPFDDREAAECKARGYRSHVWAELASGERYSIVFYDAVRLAQDLADEAEAGNPCIAEPGLIVLEELTEDNMQAAIERLADEGYFASLRTSSEMESTVRR